MTNPDTRLFEALSSAYNWSRAAGFMDDAFGEVAELAQVPDLKMSFGNMSKPFGRAFITMTHIYEWGDKNPFFDLELSAEGVSNQRGRDVKWSILSCRILSPIIMTDEVFEEHGRDPEEAIRQLSRTDSLVHLGERHVRILVGRLAQVRTKAIQSIDSRV